MGKYKLDQPIRLMSTESYALVPPQWPDYCRTGKLPNLDGHIWIASSGTTRLDYRLLALNQMGMIQAADQFCQRYQVGVTDRIYNCLPIYHIAGFAAWVRAQVADCEFVVPTFEKWQPRDFCKDLIKEQISICSLVPSQVFDLVMNQLTPPPSLRLVMVGAGHLNHDLAERARELGWPIALSYGATEMAATIACSGVGEFELKLLPHVIWQIDSDGQLCVGGPALYSGEAVWTSVGWDFWPRETDFWNTQDRFQMDASSTHLRWLGRADDAVKIKGHLVDLSLINNQWMSFQIKRNQQINSSIIAIPHERDGHALVCVAEFASLTAESLKVIAEFQSAAEFRWVSVFWIDELPRTSLGKIATKHLQQRVLHLQHEIKMKS